MIAFETFTPLRLEAVLGDADAAAALLGPTTAPPTPSIRVCSTAP
jgi:hypothetical protein